MGPTTRALGMLAVLFTIAPSTALAWKAPPAGVISIAQVREQAQTGDYLVVEGTVIERKGKHLFQIEDESGSMWVAIPDFVRRDEGTPEHTERIRVAGKYDHKKLDKSFQGVRVMTLWRGKKQSGGRGEARGAATPSDESPRAKAETPPAAAAGTGSDGATSGKPMVIRPSAGSEFVEQASAARQEWLAALAELEEASTAYGRALYEAGEDGSVDRAVVDRNEAAEARVARSTENIRALVEQARRDGVPEDVLRLYVQITTGDR